MSWLENLLGGLFSAARGAQPAQSDADRQRLVEWQTALGANRPPYFVTARLAAAASGKAPWVATMTPAELALARHKGIRPLAMVSGTCWYHYGWSWTEGHAEGWHLALARMQQEAIAVGANAIVDVKMRKIQLATGDSMDFTVLGTAVRVGGLEASRDPVVATVPALEFVRLLEAGIVPVGIAIGARYDFLYPGSSYSANLIQSGTWSFANAELPELGQFWENILRFALFDLRNDAERQGGGVLAHTHFGEILKIEEGEDGPPRFLGRHIVIGTVVDSARFAGIPHKIRTVVDMRAESSPLLSAAPHGHNAYPVHDEVGAI